MATALHNQKEIVHDSWLSEIFGREVYKITANELLSRKASIHDSFKELQGKPVFLYSKVSTTDVSTAKFLESLGFGVVDTQIVLEKQIDPKNSPKSDFTIRFAKPEDEQQTAELAKKNSTTSRFHLDPLIPKEIADRAKQEWARNYFLGRRGDQMVIAADGQKIVGFSQLLHDKKEAVIIDLIATDKTYRRKGIATSLIAFTEVNTRGFQVLRVGTQVSNIASLKLYEKLGFRTCSSHYVFHYYN